MEITISRGDITPSRMTSRLQLGVDCPARTPTSVLEFLTEQLGIPAAYVRDRIETLFLDGMVVDDPRVSIVEDGSTLGLSAAMPGLVGATLRKGGYYAPMRSQINWTTAGGGQSPRKAPRGTVRVKLYNLILREQSSTVMARGIKLAREELLQLLRVGVPGIRSLPDGELILVRIVDAPTRTQTEELPCA